MEILYLVYDKIDHTPEFDRKLIFTPHLRFFKNVHLVEVGADTKGKSCLTMFLDTRKYIYEKINFICCYFCALYRSSSAEDKSLTVYAYVNGLVCDFCARALEMTIENKMP